MANVSGVTLPPSIEQTSPGDAPAVHLPGISERASGLRAWLKVSAILAACYLLLVSAVLLGVSNFNVSSVPGLTSPVRFGLGAYGVGIAPLTERFIDLALDRDAKPAEPRPEGSVPSPPATSDTESVAPAVDHAFTNDDRAEAYDVKRLPFTGRTSTAAASRETGEPECGAQLGGTVWYRYRATRSEALLADTFGTGYQTSLAAYRSGSRGSQDATSACDFDPQGHAQIKFDATAGTTYLFQIGAAVRGGELTFNLRRFGSTLLASASSSGGPSDAYSRDPSVSSDGRYIAFISRATNLVPGMRTQGCGATQSPCQNVYLRDMATGEATLVSVAVDGRAGNGNSYRPQVSDDGRLVVFDSHATDLVPADTNDIVDVFMRDMSLGRTERISVSSSGEQARPTAGTPEPLRGVIAQGGSGYPSMSADGRYVAFESSAPNFVDGDADAQYDIFVRDRWRGSTTLVSLGNNGKPSPLSETMDAMSRNGRWIVFGSAFPLSDEDTDLAPDIFVRDLWTGRTELVSVPAPGREIEGLRDSVGSLAGSQRSISDDGRFVVFGSDGALVDGDTNEARDVFVRDRTRRTTERVTISSSGEEGVITAFNMATVYGNGSDRSGDWAISGDGRNVVFATTLNLLEPSDRNNGSDVFIHDRVHRTTFRISAAGDRAGGVTPRISGDGLHTVFSGIYALSRRDSNTFEDIFVFSPLASGEEPTQPPSCVVGEGRCFPTPQECSTGAHNGYHDGGEPGRGAICAGRDGSAIFYAGGNATESPPCGTIIVYNQTTINEAGDPNLCPGGDSDRSNAPSAAAVIDVAPNL